MIKPTGKDGLSFQIYEKEVGMTGFSLGCNSNYLTPKQLKNMGFDRIETSLGRHLSYENMVKRNLKDIHEASTLDMGITVHLPIFLSDAWRATYDYYDGFYLDPDAEKRQMSFEVLEEIKKAENQTDQEDKADITLLKEIWAEKLAGENFY